MGQGLQEEKGPSRFRESMKHYVKSVPCSLTTAKICVGRKWFVTLEIGEFACMFCSVYLSCKSEVIPAIIVSV